MHFFWYDKILFSVNGQEILLGPGNTDLSASDRLPHVLPSYHPLQCQTGGNRRLPPVLDRTMDLGSGVQKLPFFRLGKYIALLNKFITKLWKGK